jgi:predicted RNA binding protein YcfA (HicA-like mRNA interferase family)
MDRRELLNRLLDGHVRNVAFRDFCDLVEGFGFELWRIRGSHHMYRRTGVVDRVVLQPERGDTKAYQIRQFLRTVEEYDLRLEDEG